MHDCNIPQCRVQSSKFLYVCKTYRSLSDIAITRNNSLWVWLVGKGANWQFQGHWLTGRWGKCDRCRCCKSVVSVCAWNLVHNRPRWFGRGERDGNCPSRIAAGRTWQWRGLNETGNCKFGEWWHDQLCGGWQGQEVGNLRKTEEIIRAKKLTEPAPSCSVTQCALPSLSILTKS